MIVILIALFAFLILAIIAIWIGINREKVQNSSPTSIIHQSGIYSVVRKSPREDAVQMRPKEDELRQYLSEQNEDYQGKPLDNDDIKALMSRYYQSLEKNISEIEHGDSEGCEFYYYDFDAEDTVCAQYVKKGHFVTREDLFKFPQLIPPFHIGCACHLVRQHGYDRLQDTTASRLKPFIEKENELPNLPIWKTVLK